MHSDIKTTNILEENPIETNYSCNALHGVKLDLILGVMCLTPALASKTLMIWNDYHEPLIVVNTDFSIAFHYILIYGWFIKLK